MNIVKREIIASFILLIGLNLGCKLGSRSSQSAASSISCEQNGNPITVAGKTPGDFSVSPNGSTSYTVPIEGLPSANGYDPKVSLGYSSSQRNSFVGFGWTLGGFPSISRCNKSLALDGENKHPQGNDDDKFCLSGTSLTLTSDSGSVRTYKTQVETFSKIEAYDDGNLSPAYFKVFRKNGEIEEYGKTSNSRLTNPKWPQTMVWGISRVSDRFANHVNYRYSEHKDRGQLIPTSVSYGGNDKANLQHTNEIIFSYKNRGNPPKFFRQGALINDPLTLDHISVGTTDRQVMSYRIKHENDPSFVGELVKEVKKCSGCSCFEPIKFDYNQDFSIDFSKSQPLAKTFRTSSLWKSDTSYRAFQDINADGFSDLLGVRQGSSGTKNNLYLALGNRDGFREIDTSVHRLFKNWKASDHPFYLSDINSDGYSDLLVFFNDNLKVSYFNGQEFENPEDLGDKLSSGWKTNKDLRWVVDINGDGRPDLLGIKANTSKPLAYALNTGEGFSKVTDLSYFDDASVNHSRMPVDINSDGFTDIVEFHPNGMSVSLWTGETFAKPELWSKDFKVDKIHGPYLNPKMIADMNHDGVMDIVWFRDQNVYVGLGNGGTDCELKVKNRKCFEDLVLWLPALGSSSWPTKDSERIILDLNKDGFPELIGIKSGHLEIYPGNGMPLSGKVLIEGDGFDRYEKSSDLIYLRDANGDDLNDALGFLAQGVVRLENTSKAPRLSKVEDSLGHSVEFFYKTLAAPEVYKKGSDAKFPNMDYGGTSTVVSSVHSSDGIGGTKKVTYNYEGGVLNRHGLGFLGFKKWITHNHQTDTKTVRTYAQDTDNLLLGALESEVVFLKGKLISENKKTWITNTDSSGVIYNYSDREIQCSYKGISIPSNDQNHLISIDKFTREPLACHERSQAMTSEETTRTLDQYGNLTNLNSVKKDKYGTYFSETQNQIKNEADSWTLGQVERSTSTTWVELNGQPTSGQPQKIKKESSFTFDPTTGSVRTETIEPSHDHAKTITYQRNELGLVTHKTESWEQNNMLPFNQVVHETTYDDSFRLKSKKNEAGHSLIFKIHPVFGAAEEITDTSSIKTSINFDEFGRENGRTVVAPNFTETSSSSVEFCLDESSRPSHATFCMKASSSTGEKSITYFDQLERQIRTVSYGLDGEEIFQDVEYNALGLKGRTSAPYFATDSPVWTKYSYDERSRIRLIEYPTSKESFDYIELDKKHTDRRGFTTTYVMNSLGQKLLIDPPGKAETTHFSYTADGLLQTIKTGTAETTITYDQFRRKKSITTPSAGTTSYIYNSLGLKYSTTRSDDEIVYNYDHLGRIKEKTTSEGTSYWTWDAPNALGQLKSISSNGYQKVFHYNQSSQVEKIDTTISGETFETTMKYDPHGRLHEKSMPGGFGYKNHYNSHGFLNKITSPTESRTYWQSQSMYADGRAKEELYGNGTKSHYDISQDTGRIDAIDLFKGSQNLFRMSFGYDNSDNLTSRDSNLGEGWQESFTYDEIAQLQTFTTGGKTQTFEYDGFGNIRKKPGTGEFKYDSFDGCSNSGRRSLYTLAAIVKDDDTIECFDYDDNGNIISGRGKNIEYGSHGKPTLIASKNHNTSFLYDPDDRRYSRTDDSNAKSETTLYIGDYQRIASPTDVKHKFHIGRFLVVTRTGEVDEEHYLHKDHIGSTVAISDKSGNITKTFRYDPWGKSLDFDSSPSKNITQKGFTGHEMLTGVGFVHMNGRVYDPDLGRFISPDPFVQDPTKIISLNRYAYVWNNPLTNVDPSGYFSIKSLFRNLARPFEHIGSNISRELYRLNMWAVNNKRQVAAIAITTAASLAGGPSGAWAYAYFFAAGSASGYVASGGDTRAALIGGVTSMMFHGVGDLFGTASEPSYLFTELGGEHSSFQYVLAKSLSHGTVGGLSSVAQGGDFRSGFISAGVSELATLSGFHAQIGSLAGDNAMGQLALGAVSASIVGGTASELTGGDFNNGALTAAYGYTSNYVAHAVFGGAILALVSSRDIGTPYTTTDELQLVFEDVTAFSSFPGSKKIANMCRIDGAKTWKEGAYHGPKPKYTNPGHHDPKSPNFRGGGTKTTHLPDDAASVYKTAIPDPKRPGTWYGRNSSGEYYRYQGSNGEVHWNGMRNSSRSLKVPQYIKDRFNRN